MIELQVLCKVIQNKDIKIIQENQLDVTFFPTYAKEYQFIMNHYQTYGTVPDYATLVDKFNNFTPVDVQETDKYLIDKLYEEHGFRIGKPIIDNYIRLADVDSLEAFEYLKANLDEMQPKQQSSGVDILKNADLRYDEYIKKQIAEVPLCIPTGFEEQDKVLGGWQFGEELVTILARTNQGKSWILLKYLIEAWRNAYPVCMYSGEMSYNKVGYRFDTMLQHFSNTALLRGEQISDYKDYINGLKQRKTLFQVGVRADFPRRKVTVSALENFCLKHHAKILGVDQLSLVDDERGTTRDQPLTTYAHITDDLYKLSTRLGIPVILAAQANRTGSNNDDVNEVPGLDTIRGSDDVSHNSSRVIGIRQTPLGLAVKVLKNREGSVGTRWIYRWTINEGEFEYVPEGDQLATEASEQAAEAQTKLKVTKRSSGGGSSPAPAATMPITQEMMEANPF